MGEVDQALAELRAQMSQMGERLRALEIENETLRSRVEQGSSPTDTDTEAAPQRLISRRGMFAAAAGAAGGMLLAQAAPAAAASGDPLLIGRVDNNAADPTWLTSTAGAGLIVSCSDPTGNGMTVAGVRTGLFAQSSSATGTGLSGTAVNTSGASYGVQGSSTSTTGTGVKGSAVATSGRTFGVYGECASPSGYAVYALGRLKATGRSFFATPNSAPAATDMAKGSISFYLDQASNRLRVRVKYSSGVVKTGSIGLS